MRIKFGNTVYKVQRVRENGTVILKTVRVMVPPKPKPIPVGGTLLDKMKLDAKVARSQKEVSDDEQRGTAQRGKGNW